MRAIEEVERGVDKGGVSGEMIVLESNVSIVFDDDVSEIDYGRNGMSLPRRD